MGTESEIPPMSTVYPKNGKARQLDQLAQPDEQVTEEQVQDPRRLSRLLMSLVRDVARAKRRWWPRFVEHEDRTVDATGTTLHRFAHRLDSRVRWWPVDWTGATAGPRLVRHSSSDKDTLVLVSYTSGTLTLRIEEAG